jgi:hypothetical protein
MFRRWMRKISLGRPTWLRRKWRDEPVLTARAGLVRHFHELRHQELPPALVVRGVRGTGKSDLLTRMQSGFQARRTWGWAEEIDARLNFARNVAPHPLATFRALQQELRRRASVFRPARAPRFSLVRENYLREFSEQPGERGTRLAKALRAGDAVSGHVAEALDASPLPVKPSQFAFALRVLRSPWRRWAPTAALHWYREFAASLPRADEPALVEAARIEGYERGFGEAFAADMAAAAHRRGLQLGKVVVFVDAYDRVESMRRHFLVDFAREARRLRAPVMLVIGCRAEEHWSRLLDESDEIEDYGTFRVSSAVEVHHLQPIDLPDCIVYLRQRKVSGELAPRLAELSAGLPMALALLGDAFGKRHSPTRLEWQRDLLERLPPPPARGHPDDTWVRRFAAVLGEAMLEDAAPELRRHARAAAACRTFNRPLLAAMLGDHFSGEWYTKLVESPLVEPPRPSLLLGDDAAYRLRSFARKLLDLDDTEHEAVAVWHRRAQEHFTRRREALRGQERWFLIGVELLFHEFGVDNERARATLWEACKDALALGRTDRCQLLLDAAHDAGWADEGWRREVSRAAGLLYLQHGDYELAEQRLLRALPPSPEPGDTHAIAVINALTTCLRLQTSFEEAENHLLALGIYGGREPVVEMQRAWQRSLIAKARGDLWNAQEAADHASRVLREVLSDSNMETHEARARSYGFGEPAGRAGHFHRNDADIRRRGGDYRAAKECLAQARAEYVQHPEVAAESHADLVESHLRRQQGDVDGALKLARRAAERFASGPSINDRRGALMATRAVAQACLLDEPEKAANHFSTLASSESGLYPAGVALGHWGLGETARIGRQHEVAHEHFDRASTAAHAGDIVERLYVRLSLAELKRAEGEAVSEMLELLSDHEAVRAHPTLAFGVAVVSARAAERPREVSGALKRAKRVLDRFRFTTKDALEPRILADHKRAAAEAGEWPPLVFNLP